MILTADAELSYSTYLGGSGHDFGQGVTLDGSGSVFIAGTTASTDFPVTAGAFQEKLKDGDPDNPFSGDFFAVKFNAARSVEFATYLGGSDTEITVCGVAVNEAGQLTIAGWAESVDFPLANAFQGTFGGGGIFEGDMTVSRLSSDGAGLIYSTYIGGAATDQCSGIALGPNDDIFVSGTTWSADFPIVGGQSSPEAGFSDGVLVMLDNTGQPVYSIRSNRSGDDEFVAVTVADSNKASPVSVYAGTIAILEKTQDGSFESIFDFAAPGARVFTAQASGGFLAVAGDTEPTGEHRSKQSASDLDLFTALMSIGRVDVTCELDDLGILTIEIKNGNVAPIRIGANASGKVTINGEPKDIDAESVRALIVAGSNGNDEIDCTGVTRDAFPNLKNDFGEADIVILGRGGNDVLIGSLQISNRLNVGTGTNEATGGAESDVFIGPY